MDEICCFFGHRDAKESIRDNLYREVEKMVTEHGVRCFYVGGNGKFDEMAEDAVINAKIRHYGIKLCLIRPYERKIFERKALCYDKVIFPEELAGVHYRAAIPKRNCWMVSKSKYVISYIRKQHGGAYKAVKFAKENNKTIIEI